MNKELALYQLVDSAFPTGAFSHSFGLETAYKENRVRDPTELYKWITSFISGSLAPMEGRAVYIAYQALSKENLHLQKLTEDTKKQLQRLDQKLTLSKIPSESRIGTAKIGKRYLSMIETLYPESGLNQYDAWISSKSCNGNPAIVHGWIAAYLRVPVETAVYTHLYASVNNLLQSALRLAAVGQTDVQVIFKRCHALMMAETEAIIRIAPIEKDLYSCAIIQELEAMRHETLYSRLFMS